MTAPAARATLATPALALIDLDGTLVDSVLDLAAAADRTLATLGRAPCGETRVRSWVGNGIERLVHRCLTGDMDADARPAEFAPALARFVAIYAEENGRHARVYPGVREGLDALVARGARLGCVTNKPERFTEPLLARLGLRDRFDVVVSGDTVAAKKPDPAPLLHATRLAGVAPGDALLIGDSVNDVRAARAAGMPVACVTYGYNHGLDIRDAGPDAVLDSLAELDDLLGAGAGGPDR